MYGDPRFIEASHLRDEEESRVVVLPISVVEVTRQQDESDLLIDREAHQVLEGPLGAPPAPRRPGRPRSARAPEAGCPGEYPPHE